MTGCVRRPYQGQMAVLGALRHDDGARLAEVTQMQQGFGKVDAAARGQRVVPEPRRDAALHQRQLAGAPGLVSGEQRRLTEGS